MLTSFLSEDRVLWLKSRTKERAFEELAAALARSVPAFKPEQILAALLEREEVANTWVAPGLAIPHARLPLEPGRFVLAVGCSERGVDYSSSDKGLVHLMMVILAPDTDEQGFLSVLAAAAELLENDETRRALLKARTSHQVLRVLTGRRTPRRARVRHVTRTKVVLRHGRRLARETGCAAVFLYSDPVENSLPEDWAGMGHDVILVSAGQIPEALAGKIRGHIRLPAADLTRFGQINLAILIALSRGHVTPKDLVAYVTGNSKSGTLDSICLIDIDREYNMFFRPEAHGFLPPDLKPEVLERVLNIAYDLSAEGREGKPVGALFVLGDSDGVAERSRQMVLNPFRGYQEEELNVIDPSLEETIKEYSTIDGAFIIKGDGVLLAAGAYLKPGRPVKDLPSGLGARHQAAASITASTGALAIAISESTGRVTLFRNGQILLTLDRERRPSGPEGT
ncbi:MAG: PTS sugar transporter subunit IIA [Candidatus Riflebacteria bacterium]|nr:PTS sugar transporter subunit IIA [Candidatus Riflebacteria bacterium]